MKDRAGNAGFIDAAWFQLNRGTVSVRIPAPAVTLISRMVSLGPGAAIVAPFCDRAQKHTPVMNTVTAASFFIVGLFNIRTAKMQINSVEILGICRIHPHRKVF
jgi:hypothetical protein